MTKRQASAPASASRLGEAAKRARRRQLETGEVRREWDRGTDLIRMFAATGFLANVRPASLILISEPGQGKTELLDRFRVNPFLAYNSDLTVKQLYPLLRDAARGKVTHIVATEFQKYFQRKASVAENCIGTLVQAMEEGIDVVAVGPDRVHMRGARIGLIGAMTHGTLKKKRELLNEMGFLSRAAVFEWELPQEEERLILDNITRDDLRDLEPVRLSMPDTRVKVDLPERIGGVIRDYVLELRTPTAMRQLNRMRSLAMATALLAGRDVVSAADVEQLRGFDDYWRKMIHE